MNEGKVLKAIRQSTITIGDVKLGCAVLEDTTRVLTQKTFLEAIGRSRPRGGEAQKAAIGNLPVFLTSPNLNPFISDALRRSAIRYFSGSQNRRTPDRSRRKGGTRLRTRIRGDDAPRSLQGVVEARAKGELSEKRNCASRKNVTYCCAGCRRGNYCAD